MKMEAQPFTSWNNSLWRRREALLGGEDQEELKRARKPPLPVIPQPQTPREPMEFLSRSWSLSAAEIAKALAHNKPKNRLLDKSHNVFPERTVSSTQLPAKVSSCSFTGTTRRTGGSSAIGRWLPTKESNSSIVNKKDRIRVHNAHIQTAVSLAGLAAALAAIAAAENSGSSNSRMSQAIASATELLASHCIEMAESAGADRDRVSSVVRSAVDIRSPGDVMTLTASAATALRGEAALRARLPKETKRNAAISPYDKVVLAEEQGPHPCAGDLLQHTRKGALRRKHISVYINNKSQVAVKLKSKHVGGAFSKKKETVVYEVCDETAAGPVRENVEEVYFGLQTARGFLEFKCKSKIQKQRWVNDIQNLLCQANCIESTEHSLHGRSIDEDV